MQGFNSLQPTIASARLAEALPRLRLCDIGFNACDEMFRGIYHDKVSHEDDFIPILERARSVGVVSHLCTSSYSEEAVHTIAMCRRPELQPICSLKCTVGVHPCRAKEFSKGVEPVISRLDEILTEGISDGTVVAVGECGLDYDRFKWCGKDMQLVGFSPQLDLAEKYKLPLFLHSRNTNGDFLRIMRDNIHRLPAGGVVHSYTDSLEEMIELTNLGLYIGVNGCSMRTEEGMAVVAAIPEHLLLLETDAPWCGIKPTHPSHKYVTSTFPTAKREKFVLGKLVKDRNEPCTMLQVLEAAAAIRGVDPVDLAERVYENTKRLFPTIFREEVIET